MSRAWFQSQGAFVTSKRAFKATAREPRTACCCCCWCNVSYNSTGVSFSFLSWEFSRLPVSISKALLILREAANICHFSRHFFAGLFVACFINCVVNYLNYFFRKERSHVCLLTIFENPISLKYTKYTNHTKPVLHPFVYLVYFVVVII